MVGQRGPQDHARKRASENEGERDQADSQGTHEHLRQQTNSAADVRRHNDTKSTPEHARDRRGLFCCAAPAEPGGGECEDHMQVARGEQFSLTRSDPAFPSRAMLFSTFGYVRHSGVKSLPLIETANRSVAQRGTAMSRRGRSSAARRTNWWESREFEVGSGHARRSFRSRSTQGRFAMAAQPELDAPFV